jgi:hypothetical protein
VGLDEAGRYFRAWKGLADDIKENLPLDVDRLAKAIFKVQNTPGEVYFATDRRFLNAIAREYAALSDDVSPGVEP